MSPAAALLGGDLTWMPLALTIVLASIVAAYALAGAAARRHRRHRREQAAALLGALDDYVQGRSTAGALRRIVGVSAPTTFWTALEAYSVGLSRADWNRLSRVLAHSRHLASERAALRDDSPWRRELAARRIALVQARASRRALREALERGPEVVTHAAASGLARARDARALRWILDHPNAVRGRGPRAVTSILCAFGRGALPILADRLTRDGADSLLERSMIEALGVGRFTAAAVEIEKRLSHAEPEVRVAAARALGTLDDHTRSRSLIASLGDPAWQVRAQAARSLGRLSATGACEPLAARLTDRAWWVRRHAAYALRALGPEGRTALERTAEHSHDPYAREIAREALDGGFEALAG